MDETNRATAQELVDDDYQLGTQNPDYQSRQSYEQQMLEPEHLTGPDEEMVQVVYQRDQNGSLVGVESASLLGAYNSQPPRVSEAPSADRPLSYIDPSSPLPISSAQLDGSASSQIVIGAHQQLSRAASTLPSVAEESVSSGLNGADASGNGAFILDEMAPVPELGTNPAPNQPIGDPFRQHEQQPQAADYQVGEKLFTPAEAEVEAEAERQTDFQQPIYSTVNKHTSDLQPTRYAGQQELASATDYTTPAESYANQYEAYNERPSHYRDSLVNYDEQAETNQDAEDGALEEYIEINQEIGQIIGRKKAGAVEKGSFRHNFRKKLGLSVSTNENDLTTHRQKFFEQVQDDQEKQTIGPEESSGGQNSLMHIGSQKFKRTHSVSFSVGASRGNRHSVDIRNLPSYLTHKRASIVDVAKGAMSSLISSFGGGGGNSITSHRRDSITNYDEEVEDNEPIFEEPIAPTLSLGQRVAMVRNSGTEFGTVGWIGQLPDIDDDWIVGVIFDNMIGDCDGAYKGVRYFYARESYAMFVPLSVLTKTDNYIGRPETGTVLSRMSVSLKPGQLISIQRSSIRLQHCFLNAPHQRVGHDVRAVSNRLHCQCHNCGPCAHLTKQGRPSVLPHFGAHHLPIKKKNSLAHAAVEMLAHHHHHFHEEEEHEEKDYEFGDNAAHACNFVRYSCCQQRGQPGHEFSSDCGMVRPELLDNLIHAPKAPHRRSRPRRKQQQRSLVISAKEREANQLAGEPLLEAIESAPTAADTMGTLETNQSSQTAGTQTMTSTLRSSVCETTEHNTGTGDRSEGSQSSYLSSSSGSGSSSQSSCSRGSSRSESPVNASSEPYNYYQYDTSSFRPQNNVYKTVESQVSIVDQQRFVFARDSSAFVQSPMPSNWSDSQASSMTTSGLGTRLLRCLGCLKRRSGRRRHRRKLSFKDKVLEYRRRQSTFVPSTLAKPHEDFASHGLVYPGSAPLQSSALMEVNSDYSSCSRSSTGSLSSQSNSPSHGPEHDDQLIAAEISTQNLLYQQQSITLEHGNQSITNDQLKSSAGWGSYLIADAEQEYRRQLNYGDYNFSDGYDTYKYHERSKDSALTDLAYSDTYKTDCSSDTLKHLVDQSINEQVVPLEPMLEHQIAMSPLSSTISQPGCECNGSTISDQLDVSSPTASPIDQEAAIGAEELRASFENLQLDSPQISQHQS